MLSSRTRAPKRQVLPSGDSSDAHLGKQQQGCGESRRRRGKLSTRQQGVSHTISEKTKQQHHNTKNPNTLRRVKLTAKASRLGGVYSVTLLKGRAARGNAAIPHRNVGGLLQIAFHRQAPIFLRILAAGDGWRRDLAPNTRGGSRKPNLSTCPGPGWAGSSLHHQARCHD